MFHGKRLRGCYALVRMKGRATDAKPAWLLIKHRDRYASSRDLVATYTDSAVSGRTMREIASDEEGAVWTSNRAADSNGAGATTAERQPETGDRATGEVKRASFKPMLATISDDVPAGENWTFEPKYDGVRVLAYCTAGEVRLVTRNNLDKSRQFPEVTAALRRLAAATRRPLVLDGEIIAMSGRKPARFQELQGRMHLARSDEIERLAAARPVSIALFDILLDGGTVLIREPWDIRRQLLERRIGKRVSDIVLLAPSRKGNGEEMLEKARAAGWEGLIAKRTDSLYEAGVRSRSWLKLKAQHQQEFVVGGWTEPRLSREHIGAILLGYFDRNGKLVYAGHTGGGFSFASLADMHRRLKPLERGNSPFTTTPKTNERAHWVEPNVVVEVRFNEWTAEGKLRQPVFLGVREDKPASSVVRERESVQEKQRSRPRARSRLAGGSTARKATRRAGSRRPAAKRAGARPSARKPPAPGRARKRV